MLVLVPMPVLVPVLVLVLMPVLMPVLCLGKILFEDFRVFRFEP